MAICMLYVVQCILRDWHQIGLLKWVTGHMIVHNVLVHHLTNDHVNKAYSEISLIYTERFASTDSAHTVRIAGGLWIRQRFLGLKTTRLYRETEWVICPRVYVSQFIKLSTHFSWSLCNPYRISFEWCIGFFITHQAALCPSCVSLILYEITHYKQTFIKPDELLSG